MVSGKVMTDTESGYVVDHGIAVYYATIPAEIIRGHAKEHPEATMHGGIPRPRHAYCDGWVIRCLQRITDADVTALVTEVGFAEEQKQLEKFTVADAVTYGNYFEMWPNSIYRIKVIVRAPAFKDEAHVEFQFKHD